MATASPVMIFVVPVHCQIPMGLSTGSIKTLSQGLVLHVSLTHSLMLRLANVPAQVIFFKKEQAAFPALMTARLVVLVQHVMFVAISMRSIL